MKKLLLVYNPYSGNKSFPLELDAVINILQNEGKYAVIPYRMSSEVDFQTYLESFDKNEIDTVCVSGGDGTINIVINELFKNDMSPNIGLFPSGTANDFCSSLGFSKDHILNAKIIAHGKTRHVDVGKVNGKYFVNVICIGLFAEVSQGVDKDLKNTIGKLAYYVQGAKVLSSVNPMNVRITTPSAVIEEYTYLILILNSDRAGGFKLAPLSEMNDGSFDLVLFHAKSYQAATTALLKVLNGNHVTDENVLYLQESKFIIENLDENIVSETDIDGEKGPYLPLDVEVLPKKLNIFVPPKKMNK